MEVQFHMFLSLAVDEKEWSASCFTQRTPCVYLTGHCGLDATENR